MRKIYAALLSLSLFLTINTKLNAQAVGTYVFSPSTSTYTPLAGATTSTATGDDGTQNVAIGFNFVFGGVTYTNAVISTNGAIKLAPDGTTTFATSWVNNLSNTYNAAIVGAAWDDNNATGGSVVYLTTGTAPNRTFSVEWINNHMGGVGSTTTPTATFQLTLSEGSNSIRFVYGTINPLTLSSIGIGLNDLVSFLSVTPGTPATASSATANNNITSAANLASGTTYTFLPPPPCVAPPGGGTTTGPAGTICAGLPFTLTVTGSSFGTGLTYQWEFSTDGGSTWNPVPTGGTGTAYTGAITVNTQFRRKITCTGVDAYSTALLVSVSPPIAIPFTETFAAYATTFPPTCWTRNSTTAVIGAAQSAFGVGTGSAKIDFYNTFSGNLDLATAAFAPVPANHWLTFNHAYATFSGEVDQLQILYSTDGGTTYTLLVTYAGGAAGPLNTGGTTTAVFAPTAAQWASKNVTLPVGTNKLLFRGVAAFGNNLFLDNITVEPIPPCLPPTGLTTTAMSPTTATLSWTASTSNPSNGYQWEVRTSGAAGSGATGLAASGVTAAGVTTANVTTLTANTTYSYYVRSDCGGAVFSAWTGAFVFTTPCNPIAIPFTETFATYATTFPPTCWTRNNTTFLTGNAANAYVAGTGSAKFDFYNASSGTNLDLVSPLFTAVPAGHRVVFDHAYATFAGENDQLQISYSTDGGATYTSLITYNGGTGGPLNTAGAVLPAFTPSVTQWAEKAVDLPVGTNRLRFRGVSAFGNNLYLDNIKVELTPSCLPVVGAVTALSTTPTSVIISFTPPASGPTVGYIVEYGPPAFTPGTDNTPGAGGTLVLGPGSPITVPGLTPSTTYDFYVRRICIAGVDFSTNKKVTATTLCPATNIPYVQNFETSVPLVGFPTCTSMEDVNGNSGPTPNGGGGRWITNNIAQTYVSPTRSLWYIYDLGNPARGGDDWFYLQGLNLTAGVTYRVKAYYKGSDAPTWFEKFEIKYGNAAHSSAMTNLIYSNPGTTTAVANPFDSLIADFTPSATGVYYIGFHNISDPDQAFLFIDDISVRIAPVADVGISGITLPSLNCPTSGVFVQARIRNYNTVVHNFATYPVTVTANITGAGTGTLTTTINAGTLAAGAEMQVYLNPAYNFTAGGIYTITTATSSAFDSEPGNDANITTVNVNPNPPAPVITPAVAQLCVGGQVQLNTQFTNPPPPAVTLPAVSSGAITVNVPDGNAVGATHTLSVSGVPAGATLTGISVTINLTHTWVSDMVVNLRGPNNNVLNLFNARGGSGDNMTNMVISSASTTSLATALPPFTGTFAADAVNGVGPTGNVSNVTSFAGLYSIGNGNWTLAMRDLVGLDVGILTSWSITLTYQMLNPVVTWTPVAGLFTNATATTAYTAGTDLYSVYAKPAATTTYTATATTLAGCTATGTATVTVNPLPSITIGSIPDTVCISDPVIALPATPVGGNWTGIGVSGNTFIPPATAIGTYTLTYSYTSEFGCVNTATKRIAVKDCPERIIRLSDNAVILFPNPNNGLFNIRINSVLYNYLGMKVYSSNGTLVRTQQLGGLTWGRVIPIDLTNLPGGVYMVHFYYDDGIRSSDKTFKVVIGLP
ncbi:MAG TPA: fibronectin type III domain-containing protein [Chitinophagaceae bacterium]